MKVTILLIVMVALLGFGLVAAAKADSAPAPAASVQASSPVASDFPIVGVTDDDPIPPILVWWLGCRYNDVRYTNGTVICYMPDGISVAWTKAVDSSGWIRIRSFPYSGGTMTGVANLIPGVP